MKHTLITIALFVLFVSGGSFASAQSYTYDAGGRLTLVAYSDGSGIRYNYDEADNLLSVLPISLPVPPSAVTTTTDGPDSIIVSWEGTAAGNTLYVIERRSGANNAWETIASVSPATKSFIDEDLEPGTDYFYRVSVSGASGSSAYSSVSGTSTEQLLSASFPVSLSTRAQVGSGDTVLIPGIAITGTEPKQILIRGIGPALEEFDVTGYLEDPVLTVFDDDSNQIAFNDDWEDNTNLTELQAAFASTFAFPLPPGSADSAVLLTVQPGAYTAVISGKAGGTGVGLVEVYDVDRDNPNSRFASISGRAFVGSGDQVLIPGIAVDGDLPQTFLIRAIGPTLEEHGVNGVLEDPQLTIFEGSQSIASNDNWGDAANAAEVAATSEEIFAFPLPSDSLDAVLLITLDPGLYSVVVSGVGNTTGIALVEVYQVD